MYKLTVHSGWKTELQDCTRFSILHRSPASRPPPSLLEDSIISKLTSQKLGSSDLCSHGAE
ncbi:hypothetical protein T265_16003, partial [Opisthorchis viverrini]